MRKKVLIIGCLIGGSIGPLIGEKMQMISRVHSTEAFAVGTFPGLRKEALIIRDKYGVPHIKAKSDADAYFAMGYMHAKDRFFQMDYSRRRGSGTLAELIGAGPGDTILSGDINQRNLGIRRAAERSREICPPEYLGLLEAYSAGVNEWLNNNDLPPEYNLLELTKAQVPRWEVLDSLAIAKAVVFNFAYETSDMLNTALLTVYEKAGKTNGFDGAKLFSEDLFGYKPFWPASSISPPHVKSADNNRGAASKFVEQSGRSTGFIKPETISAITAWFHDSTRHSPMEGAEKITGSNCWVIGGSKTINKASLIANDPHLPLAAPAVFYEIHLMVEKALHQPPMNVYGVSFAGVPGVVLGFNENIAWGATTGRFDVTDIYQEQVRIDPNTQLPTATIYRNVPEPVVVIPEKFRLNQVGNRTDDDIIEVPVGKRSSGVVVPQATIIVPRRNNGPLITMPSGPDAESLTALSVQFTGFSPTFELASSFIWARATNVNEFKEGVQRFKVGSLNWCYADVKGNIAYFTSGVIPLREDLQSGKVVGAAPYFVRDGSGVHRHEWVKSNPSSTIGSLPFKILPFAEMPQIVNPPEGFIVTANNDPMGVTFDGDPVNQNRAHGTGIYYLGARFDAGFRAVRITNLLSQRLEPAKGDRKLGLRDMAEIQSDVVMLDAQVFTPYILRAWEAARASNAPAELSDFTQDREMTEAVERLSKWDFSAPTGITEGYDAADKDGNRLPPMAEEVAHSIAATLYSVWRGQIIRNTIDSALQRVGLNNVMLDSRDLQVARAALSAETSLVALRTLLDDFAARKGCGISGIDFFVVPGLNRPAEIRRDFLILKSLKDALSLLSSDAFAPAFNRSTNQSDYQFGKLHRATISHSLTALVPQLRIQAGGSAGLPSILSNVSVDGGFEVVDWSSHGPRASTARSFTFMAGAARRFLAELLPGRVRAMEVIPGGESGVPGNEFFGNMMGLWLTNDFHEAYLVEKDIYQNKSSIEILRPAK